MPLLLIEAAMLFLLAYLSGVCLGCFLRWSTRASTHVEEQKSGQISVSPPSVLHHNTTFAAAPSTMDKNPAPATSVPVSRPLQTIGIAARKTAHHSEAQMVYWPIAMSPEGAAAVAPLIAHPDPGNPRLADHRAAQDLTRIKGIDGATANLLLRKGVTRYEQIATWNENDVARINRSLSGITRIQQENWIEQACILAAGGQTLFTRQLQGTRSATVGSRNWQPDSTVLAPRHETETTLTVFSRSADTAPIIAAGRPGEGLGDDLKRIRGINEQIEAKLNHFGFNTYEQLSNWTQSDIERVSRHLEFQGRIERENWIEQAKVLSLGGQTEFSQRFDRGEFQQPTAVIDTDH